MRVFLTAAFAWLLVGCGASEESVSGEQTDTETTSPPVASASKQAEPPRDTVTYECPDDAPTIVGLCLGMDSASARATLRAHAAAMQFKEKTLRMEYTDGVERQYTDPFVYEIRGHVGSDGFVLRFSPPPGEQALVQVERNISSYGEITLPTVTGYIAAIEDKYGEPTFRRVDDAAPGQHMTGTLRWLYPEGATLCARLDPSGFAANQIVTPGENIAYNLERTGHSDPSRCATVLQVRIQSRSAEEPALSANTILLDVSAAAASEIAMFNWLDDLEAKAREERLAGANAPKL